MRRVNASHGGSDLERVRLPRALFEQMLSEARAAPGVETCGLIIAREGAPIRCTAIRNVAAEPRRRFRMDPQQQIAAFRHMREHGEELFGIYHSHPESPAKPSATDLGEAGYPEALQFILSLKNAAAPELRAYRFHDGGALPVQLQIETSAG